MEPIHIEIVGPQGCADTLSHDGKTYVAEKGVFTVPAQAFEALKRHGFAVATKKKAKGDAP